MNAQCEIVVTFRGPTLGSVVEQAKALIDANADPTETVIEPARRTRKSAADKAAEEAAKLAAETTGAASEGVLDFMAQPAAKAPKYTDKDINEACVAYGRVHGRPAVMTVLKKHGAKESVLELDPKTYAAVIADLKV